MSEIEILRLLLVATKRIGGWITIDLGTMFSDGWNKCVNHGWIDIEQDRKCRLTTEGYLEAAKYRYSL